MQVRVQVGQPWEVRADVAVVPVAGVGGPGAAADGAGAADGDESRAADGGAPGGEGGRVRIEGHLAGLDGRLGGQVRALAAFGDLTGKRHAFTLLAGAAAGGESRLGAGWVLLAGTGDAATLDAVAILRWAAAARRRLRDHRVATMAVWLDPLIGGAGGAARAAELVARGVELGAYDPAAIYRESPRGLPPVLDELVLVASPDGAAAGIGAPDLEAAAARGLVIGEGANWLRRLADRTANDVTPAVLADEAATIARRHSLWLDVIGPDRAEELGMGMFLAVGKGSANPPRLILLRSGAQGERDAAGRHLALVGKGVCFDTGGLSLKPPSGMLEMKHDKTGACTVLAALDTVMRLAPGTPLLVVAPAVENMPGPHATRPSDVVTALNGKRVEITNTDAEGRLILGDAMTYAERLGATHLVDIATLTGAAHRALGSYDTPLFGTDEGFTAQVLAASRLGADRLWPFPMPEELRPDLASNVADLLNAPSKPEGGAIHAALFLREFRTRPWAHLDIAGTAYAHSNRAWAPRGALGTGHATLVELALAGGQPPSRPAATRGRARRSGAG